MKRCQSVVVVLSTALLLSGCSDAETEEKPEINPGGTAAHEHKAPETYAEAMEEITSLVKTIREGFEADDLDAAHGPLHDIGHALEAAKGFVGDESISDDEKANVTAALDKLFECFGALDEKMHGGDGKDYKDVSADITAAMATLASNGATALNVAGGEGEEEMPKDDGASKEDGASEEEE